MYIRDQRNTKGHVTSLTGGQWHPTDRNTVRGGGRAAGGRGVQGGLACAGLPCCTCARVLPHVHATRT